MAASGLASTVAIMSKGPLTDCSRRTPGRRFNAAVTAAACFGSTVSIMKAWTRPAS